MISDEIVEKVRKFYFNPRFWTVKQIADMVGVSSTTVLRIIRKRDRFKEGYIRMSRSDRARINQYARRQEDRMEERMKDMGFELVEDAARRTVKAGDKIMRHKDTGLLVVADHKSTQNKTQITVKKEQLEKIKMEAWRYDKSALPMITISFKGSPKLYAIIDLEELEGVMY